MAGGMAYMLVTCPETAHLELIDYDSHPLGLLIRECSRFRPPCAIHCGRTCAARLDRRDRQQCEEEEAWLEVGDITRLDVLAALR